MNIILDSNILFSALIKDSMTREIILKYDGFFLFPGYIFNEMEKHKSEIMKKSRMGKTDFEKLLKIILKKVLIVPSTTLIEYKQEAVKIIKDIDIDDVIFIACALAYPESIIWSDDKHLKKQKRVVILNTKEIIEKLD